MHVLLCQLSRNADMSIEPLVDVGHYPTEHRTMSGFVVQVVVMDVQVYHFVDDGIFDFRFLMVEQRADDQLEVGVFLLAEGCALLGEPQGTQVCLASRQSDGDVGQGVGE